LLIGFDPGISGAFCVLYDDGSIAEVLDMPVVEVSAAGGRRKRIAPQILAEHIVTWNSRARNLRAVVERVGAMPGQGVSSMFTFGHGAGLVEGVLAGLKVPTTLVAPNVWKRALRLPADKGAARMRAMQEWPGCAGLFSRVRDSDRAEAALLALWARRFNSMEAA
jgi:crossover junction endodeoxyribonuclease RuvC